MTSACECGAARRSAHLGAVVGTVAIAFGLIAPQAERLNIRNVTSAAFVHRNDMIGSEFNLRLALSTAQAAVVNLCLHVAPFFRRERAAISKHAGAARMICRVNCRPSFRVRCPLVDSGTLRVGFLPRLGRRNQCVLVERCVLFFAELTNWTQPIPARPFLVECTKRLLFVAFRTDFRHASHYNAFSFLASVYIIPQIALSGAKYA